MPPSPRAQLTWLTVTLFCSDQCPSRLMPLYSPARHRYSDCPEVPPYLQSLPLGEDSTAALFYLTGRHKDHSRHTGAALSKGICNWELLFLYVTEAAESQGV